MRHWLLGCLLVFTCMISPALAAEKVASPDAIAPRDEVVIDKKSAEIVRFNEKIVVAKGQTIEGDVVAIGGPVDVHGTVKGNAVAIGGSVTLLPGGKVEGDAIAIGGKVAKKGGSLTGSETSIGPNFTWHDQRKEENDWPWKILRSIGMIALLTLLAAIFPKPMERMTYAAERAPLASLLWGIAAMLAFIPLMVLLVISLIGILLIPVEVLLYLAAALFGTAGISTLVGGRLLQGKGNVILFTLLGAFVLQLVGLVPFLGWLVNLIVFLFGLGAVVISRFGTREATTIA